MSDLHHGALPAGSLGEAEIGQLIRAAAEPLPPIEDTEAFGAAFDRFAEARVVLLGEATHGTHEFYRARAAITRRLIERHGFGIVAVEADWPDAARIDRWVRQRDAAQAEAEPAFARFPTWMWRNTEVRDFTGWLRTHNAGLPPEQRAEFRGLDVYSLGNSIAAVLAYRRERPGDGEGGAPALCLPDALALGAGGLRPRRAVR
jgi:erythromycin esterase-like protein